MKATCPFYRHWYLANRGKTIYEYSYFYFLYESFIHTPLSVPFFDALAPFDIKFVVNDIALSLFFLIVGLELRLEFIEGEFKQRKAVALPALAALGGVVVPAAIYYFFNADTPTEQGWAIPAATDIAIAVSMLAFIKTVPKSMKIFLLSIAIFDDIYVLIIIALFYSSSVHALAILFSLILLFILREFSKTRLVYHYQRFSGTVYAAGGICIWSLLIYGGVHPTLAGCMLAFTFPLATRTENIATALDGRLIFKALKLYVELFILPLFAFVNAGIYLGGVSQADLLNDFSLGVVFGLVIGKPLGIILTTMLLVGLGFAVRPDASRSQFVGTCCMCGIGFTMSCFIGELSLDSVQIPYQIPVLIGSSLSCLLGAVLLTSAQSAKHATLVVRATKSARHR
ncbi:Na+/H+ antiporter NhaA [Thaumasiovibrio subtropicus]|uniref:Na+/H+ antiporter NhaA n=2 Tax=Thaumasiovibrio subtropicus TaxID=1891207 RepID=UPI001C845B8F|nr:Na+/H+ antiporter NhaA [Thaumasiovibrio subtropicus]